MKRLSIILLIFYSLACQGQDELDAYLKDHHYAFSIDSGFNRQTTEILKQKMSKYRLFICGEGGSHYLQFYEPLLSMWTRFLNQQFGMTRFFLETGHSADVLFNHYLQTGDSSHL